MSKSFICCLSLSLLAAGLLAGCGSTAAPPPASITAPTPSTIPATILPPLAVVPSSIATIPTAQTPLPAIAPTNAPSPTPLGALAWASTPQPAGAGVIIHEGCGKPYIYYVANENHWYEQGTNRDVLVCAGSAMPTEIHAAIVVAILPHNGAELLQGPDVYQVPGEAQSVKIIGAVGETLTLQADTGVLFYFDVSARQWVSATAQARKQADLQAQQDREATRAAISPAPMRTYFPTYPPEPTVVLPFGIAGYEDCGGGEPGQGWLRAFLIRNCWRGYLAGVYSGVIAGAELAPATPGEWTLGGVVIMTHLDDSDQLSVSPIYWTPVTAGAVEIVGVASSQFTLHSASGATFIFDAETHQWVGQTPAPSPSPAQSPLPSPSAGPSATP